MPECEKCINEHRIIAMEKDAERNSEQHKEFYAHRQVTAVEQAKSETLLNQIFTSLSKIESKVDELESKPSKRWETVITAIISVVVGLGVGILTRG